MKIFIAIIVCMLMIVSVINVCAAELPQRPVGVVSLGIQPFLMPMQDFGGNISQMQYSVIYDNEAGTTEMIARKTTYPNDSPVVQRDTKTNLHSPKIRSPSGFIADVAPIIWCYKQ